jgi:hypothetical protein
MDYTKTSTFIAFVNKDGKNRYWCHGNYVYDEDTPKIYPYETKEDKKNAIEIGQRFGVWDETGDIEALVLKVSGSPIPILLKKDAKSVEEKMLKENAERIAKRKENEASEKKKVKDEAIAEKVVEKPVEKVKTEKVEEKVSPTPEVKKRGRPKVIVE